MRDLLSSTFVNRTILRFTILAGWIGSFVSRHQFWLQAVAGTVAMSLGLIGWMIQKPPTNLSQVLDNVFRTVQLITLQFPNDIRESPTILLQIARLVVPLVAVLASFQILVASIARPARLALLPYISGHIIIYGAARLTEGALASLASRGNQVVLVVPEIGEHRRAQLEGLGITVLVGDLLQSATIGSLHLSKAAAIFLTGDDVANINIAVMALSTLEERPEGFPPLVLAVNIEHEELAIELDAALDGLSRRYSVRYHRLSAACEALRLELVRFAPALMRRQVDARSHVLVVGLFGDWQQIAARIIIATQDHPEKRPVLTFVVSDSEAASVKRWRDSKPELDLIVEIAILIRAENALLPASDAVAPWRGQYAFPQLAVVLLDDANAIGTMFALRRPGNPLGTEAVPVLVHQSNEDRLLASLSNTQVRNRDMTRLVAFGGLVRAESIERVLDRKGDEIAIALHAHYRDAAQTLGAGSPAALEAWDNLPENLREANRSVVEHAPILFAAADFRLISAEHGAQSVALSDAELELLARVEHRRWMADRINKGWRYSKTQDDRMLLHPDLVPYESLSENNKEKDRNSVRVLLSALRGQGMAIVRSASIMELPPNRQPS